MSESEKTNIPAEQKIADMLAGLIGAPPLSGEGDSAKSEPDVGVEAKSEAPQPEKPQGTEQEVEAAKPEPEPAPSEPAKPKAVSKSEPAEELDEDLELPDIDLEDYGEDEADEVEADEESEAEDSDQSDALTRIFWKVKEIYDELESGGRSGRRSAGLRDEHEEAEASHPDIQRVIVELERVASDLAEADGTDPVPAATARRLTKVLAGALGVVGRLAEAAATKNDLAKIKSAIDRINRDVQDSRVWTEISARTGIDRQAVKQLWNRAVKKAEKYFRGARKEDIAAGARALFFDYIRQISRKQGSKAGSQEAPGKGRAADSASARRENQPPKILPKGGAPKPQSSEQAERNEEIRPVSGWTAFWTDGIRQPTYEELVGLKRR